MKDNAKEFVPSNHRIQTAKTKFAEALLDLQALAPTTERCGRMLWKQILFFCEEVDRTTKLETEAS